ncbi:glutaredoxin family protein [Solemya velesiana gill symbiont]|uniref:Thioredoxin family protein n=1 Tax=Solemya velesiana gill symbiont TaxID=1918948 RepID=A0A1T2KX24_9GAMM|nr:glutaredoxin family protein [Solemya velesiana gill symbiont]OOZ37372.1 hypothetical protein BOW51_02655 [Solemya velesiana gill symbiont]
MSQPGICFTLYTRNGCHLCEDMRWQLVEMQKERGFEFNEIDIDADPELEKRYGTLIPVLALGEKVLCNYYLDPVAVNETLARE